MTKKQCLLVCENYFAEAKAVVESEAFSDVSVVSFPGRCGHPAATKEINEVLESAAGFSHVSIIGSSCLVNLSDLSAKEPQSALHKAGQCFYMLADEGSINDLIRQGAYLLTPGWLAHWQERINDWGFEPSTAREFFRDFSRELVLLDTGVYPQSLQNLRALADFVDRPFRTVPVGLGYFRLYLSKIVLQWRLQNEKEISTAALNSARKEISEFAMSFEMIGQLTQSQTEAEVVQNIIETFRMLFAPKYIAYLPLKNNFPGEFRLVASSPVDNEAAINRLTGFDQKYAWTESGRGFRVSIRLGKEILGVLEVDEIAFPEYKQHYLNMAFSVVGVCALAIENARKFEKIEANLAEKQVLLQEIHHRVKNNLAVISSLLSFQEDRITDNQARAALQDSQNRVQTMAMVHETLYRSDSLSSIDMQTYFCELGDLIFQGQSVDGRVVLRVEGENVRMAAKPATSIGLIVNELITNSLKHAFPGDARGEIVLGLTQNQTSEIMVTIADNGVGLAKGFDVKQSDSLGLLLVKILVEDQLGGSFDMRSENGTVFSIKFKLD
jgi:two-component sensor histidine kinase